MASLEMIDAVMEMLISNWPKEPTPKKRNELYFQLLQDIPDELLRAGVVQVIATAKFFPTIAEIRETCHSLTPQMSGTPTAGEAWGEVLREIRRTGADQWNGAPKFSHELIGRAVKAMGWRELALSEDPMPDRAHFFRVYEALAQREVAQAKLLPEVRALAEGLRAKALADGSEP